MLAAFFRAERERAGWRFWMLWVGTTNLGFSPGVWIGNELSAHTARYFALAEPITSATIGATFTVMVGSMQWLVLRRHLNRIGWWVIATAVG